MDHPPYSEIATIADGRDITRGYLTPLLQYQDKILQIQGGSDLEIYEEIYRDDQVRACAEQRRKALISWPWEVRPGKRRFAENTDADQKAADFISEILSGIKFDRITQKMHFGFFYGYSVAEILYAREGNYIVWDDRNFGLKIKRAKRFRFDSEQKLRLLTFANMWQGEALPERKFWVFNYGADNDDEPYGLGDAHFCYWPVTIKRQGLTAWTTFLKKFAMPFVLGKYPPGTTPQEQAKLKAAIRAIASGTGGTIPDGMLIELIEASRTGNADFAQIYQMMDSSIARIILGETMTIDAAGGQYKGDTHADVKQELVQADADDLCASFSQGPIQWLIDYNRGALGDAVTPEVWRVCPEQEDLLHKADIWQRLWGMGFEPKEAEEAVGEAFGGEWQRRAATPLEQQPGSGQLSDRLPSDSTETPEFQERDEFADQTALDTAIEAITPEEMDGLLGPILRPIIEMVQTSPIGEVEDRLLELFPELDTSQLEAFLAQALFVSDQWGRINAQQEVEANG